nr:hypothetical protein HmN_000746700 [Hymenolepis microstoma]
MGVRKSERWRRVLIRAPLAVSFEDDVTAQDHAEMMDGFYLGPAGWGAFTPTHLFAHLPACLPIYLPALHSFVYFGVWNPIESTEAAGNEGKEEGRKEGRKE